MKNILSSLFLLSTLSLIGCGGGSSSTPSTNLTQTGVFIDAPVAGLAFNASPSGETGTTNPAGEFKYKNGDRITFLMGALELGDGVPDSNKEIKITQLDKFILVGQLLQTLDTDADENKIDVTGITIPAAINTTILDKLENGSVNDVLSPADLVEIKASNADIIATIVKTKADVAAHIVEQTGDQSLIFTEAELNNHLLVSADALSYANNAMIVRFDEGRQLRWIDGDQSPLSYYSKHDWTVVGGKIEIMFTNADGSPNKCIATKFSEDATTVDASVSCESSPNGLIHFLKPQPFSVSDLSGKDITINGVGGQTLILTFNTDGTYDSNGGDSGLEYMDSRFANTVWLRFDQSTPAGAIFLLAEGTITDGTLVVINYDEFNNFDGVDIIGTSGITWTLLHGTP